MLTHAPPVDPRTRVHDVAPNLHLPSLRVAEGMAAWLEPDPTRATRDRVGLLVPAGDGALVDAEGTVEDAGGGLRVVHGPLSAANAHVLRARFPDLAPRPQGLAPSAAFADPLGVATPGHARALHAADPYGRIRPFFARYDLHDPIHAVRDPREVTNDATWGAFAAGWTAGSGAHAYGLETDEQVRRCVRAGFTLITFDLSAQIDDHALHAAAGELEAKLSELPWDTLRIKRGELRRTYLSRTFDADGLPIRFDDLTLARAAAKYGHALALAVHLHTVLQEDDQGVEIDWAIAARGARTTLAEHAYVALELRRLGLPAVSLAPRIEPRAGSGHPTGEAEARMADGHARVARAFGPYKLSLLAPGDDAPVRRSVAAATCGRAHLQVTGAAQREALRVAASHDPALCRRLLALRRKATPPGASPHLGGNGHSGAERARLLELLEAHRETYEARLEGRVEPLLKCIARQARRAAADSRIG